MVGWSLRGFGLVPIWGTCAVASCKWVGYQYGFPRGITLRIFDALDYLLEVLLFSQSIHMGGSVLEPCFWYSSGGPGLYASERLRKAQIHFFFKFSLFLLIFDFSPG